MKQKIPRKVLRSAGAFLLRMSALVGRGKLFHRAQIDADRRLAVKLESWIESRGFLNDVSQEKVAVEMGVDPRELSYYSSNILGEPFRSWRNRLRLLEARQIIASDPDIPLSLVGRMVGIPDKSNFRKLFRNCFGISPGEWREISRKKNNPS